MAKTKYAEMDAKLGLRLLPGYMKQELAEMEVGAVCRFSKVNTSLHTRNARKHTLSMLHAELVTERMNQIKRRRL
jgi:hypothetical protein